MKGIKFIWFILLGGIISCGQKTDSDPKNIESYYPYSIIANKYTAPDTLLKAIDNLDSLIKESPAFWSKIANDASYNPFHRGICGITLLKRHLKNRTQLTGLRSVTGDINWIKREDITSRCLFRGGGNWKLFRDLIGLKHSSVFCIKIFPELEDTIHFKNIPDRSLRFRVGIDQEVPLQKFADFILNGKTDSLINKSILVGIEPW